MAQIRSTPTAAALGAVLLLLAGCGQTAPRVKVSGVVRREGRPLADVLVTFLPDSKNTSGGRAVGVTDAEGRFHLRGENQQEGALPGGYVITIEDLAIYAAPRSEDGTVLSLPPPRFPPLYSDPLKTKLRRSIAADELALELDVTAE
jgi:hypothetical protein